jgi:hypothetical protein
MTPFEVEEACREVWLLEQLFKEERVRVNWVEPIAKSCLRWVADKAAGAAVGKYALKVLAAIGSLFGFSV